MTTTFVETPSGEPFAGITFEEGDVQISINGGVFQNVGTLPTTRRPDSAIIDLTFLSAAENVVGAEIRFLDQTVPPKWYGETITIEQGDDEGDVAPAIIVSAILQNAQIMQLISDAAASRDAAEANGTALATPDNFKADTSALTAATTALNTAISNLGSGETIEAYDDTALIQLVTDLKNELGKVKKLGEPITHTRVGGGSDTTTETRASNG